jgi:ferredoxin-NADP reductase
MNSNRAKIVKIKSETYNVKTIRFKVPIQLTHQPGQYGTFTFEIGGLLL